MSLQYVIASAVDSTTAARTKVALSAATIKTVLQFKPILPCKLISWGFSLDNTSANVPGQVELLDTGTIAATVSAVANADITKFNAAAREFGDPTSALISVGTSATGFNASAEGSITATAIYDMLLDPPTQPYAYQWPLGREPELKANNLIRIRANFASAVNCWGYMVVEF